MTIQNEVLNILFVVLAVYLWKTNSNRIFKIFNQELTRFSSPFQVFGNGKVMRHNVQFISGVKNISINIRMVP